MSLGRKKAVHVVLAALVVANCVARAQTQAPTSVVPAFTLELLPPNGPFKLGEPIHLKMRMANTSDSVVYVLVPPGPSWGDEIVGVDMTDSTRRPVIKWRELKMMENGGRLPMVRGSFRSDDIPARLTIEREVRLEKVFKITAPGHYTVRIGRWDYESKISVKSEPIEIDILPAL